MLREDRQDILSVDQGQEQAAPAASVRVQKVVIAVATEGAWPLSHRIEARLGTPIRLWQRLDPEVGTPDLSDDEVDDTRDRISGAPGDRVLLTLDASGVAIVAFRE